MVLSFIFMGSSSIASSNLKFKILSENSDNWNLVKEDGGLRAYVSQYVDIDGTLSLKIKFENSTNQDVKLNWVLINKNSKKSLSESFITIKAKSFFVFLSKENPIPVNYGETVNDLSMIFK
mgnify:CR=1 FL=1